MVRVAVRNDTFGNIGDAKRTAQGLAASPPRMVIAPRGQRHMTKNIPLPRRQRGVFAGKLVAILACGGIGGIAAWSIVGVMGWGGTSGAFVAALIAMVISVVLWAAGVAALQSLDRRR